MTPISYSLTLNCLLLSQFAEQAGQRAVVWEPVPCRKSNGRVSIRLKQEQLMQKRLIEPNT